MRYGILWAMGVDRKSLQLLAFVGVTLGGSIYAMDYSFSENNKALEKALNQPPIATSFDSVLPAQMEGMEELGVYFTGEAFDCYSAWCQAFPWRIKVRVVTTADAEIQKRNSLVYLSDSGGNILRKDFEHKADGERLDGGVNPSIRRPLYSGRSDSIIVDSTHPVTVDQLNDVRKNGFIWRATAGYFKNWLAGFLPDRGILALNAKPRS